MIVLIAWIVAALAAALILGIIGFGLVGQLRRLRTSLEVLRADVLPRVSALQREALGGHTGGRHSAER
ncbi:hypothetical protein BH20ACT5_BH20ACT5_24780 [soil metagenome]